jgi:probable rRNA maturation factor
MVKVLFNVQSNFQINQPKIIQAIKNRLNELDYDQPVVIEVAVVGSRKMAELNKQYRGKSGPTDVLSFEMNQPQLPDGVVRLGEIVICPPETDQIDKMIIHGLNHLLGIHHND